MNTDLYQIAQKGLAAIENAIIDLLNEKKEGLTNSQIAQFLGLQSSQGGNQKDYLTYSILGILMERGLIRKIKNGRRVLYISLNQH